MSFQLLNIFIYGTNGKIRSINFKLNSVNIITGRSQTGKSALIHIVEYCLGRRRCNIPAGIIRNYVEWYAIKLYTSSGEIFIARRNPEKNKQYSEDIYFERGTSLPTPESESLIKNMNSETLELILSEILGIEQYSHEIPEGQTRSTGIASIKKALYFCFQEQGEVANQRVLFHRQGEDFVPQSIKDYIPYFLGAVTTEHLQNQQNLRNFKRERKILESKIAERKSIKGQSFNRAFSLINEAKNVDLIEADEKIEASWGCVRKLIVSALNKPINDTSIEPNVDILNSLLNRQQELRELYKQSLWEISSLEDLKNSSNGLNVEIAEQKSRLQSINLFQHGDESNTCPICASLLTEHIPSAEVIRKAILDIDLQLEDITNDTPYLDSATNKAREHLGSIKRELGEIVSSIIAIQKTNKHLAELRDFNAKCAMIKGKLSLYLENIPTTEEDTSEDELSLKELNIQISRLVAILDKETVAERLKSYLSNISMKITELAKELDIEHSNYPMRLDIQKLTVITDNIEDGPIPMSAMGSGETWVGIHLVTHLALHDWFFKKKRPVPRFLFLDQPSQAYFPSDISPEDVRQQTEMKDHDRKSVIRMFKLIIKESMNFQIIITEHANFQEQWYQDLVRESWWDGKQKLVPIEWVEVE